MKSVKPGRRTSSVEVTNVSRRGLWLLARGKEWFLAFEQFPWFLDAPLGAILDVEVAGPGHLRWPRLDVDIDVESIRHPERFPLVSKVRPDVRSSPPRPRSSKRAANR